MRPEKSMAGPLRIDWHKAVSAKNKPLEIEQFGRRRNQGLAASAPRD
jgi:hypothetical protein